MTQNELTKKYPVKIPIMALAKHLGMSYQTLGRGIDDGKFPFGVNVGIEGRTNRYLIFTDRYLAWANGDDIRKGQ